MVKVWESQAFFCKIFDNFWFWWWIGVEVSVTAWGCDLLMPQDLTWHGHSSRNKNIKFLKWGFRWLKYILDIFEYSYIFIIANSSWLVFFPIAGNPRWFTRRSSLHHPWVSLNFNARFSDQLFINIIQSN